jgi:hypothetical protein
MYDVVAIGKKGDQVVDRARQVASDFGFSYHAFANAEEILDAGPAVGRSLSMVLSTVDSDAASSVASAVQTVKFAIPDAYLIVVIGSRLKQADAEFVKKSGASLVLMENEVIMTSKIEFILSQKFEQHIYQLK